MPTGTGTVFDSSGSLTILDNMTVSRSVAVGTTINWLRVTNIRVGLVTLAHSFSNDLDFLIVGPDGRNLVFWSDAGFSSHINGNYTISDTGASSLSVSGTNPSGTYKPTDY